jgi:hypothetical protein
MVAVWLMQRQLTWGLKSGWYPKEAESAYAVELLLFYFITCGLMVLFLFTFVGLPVLAALRRLRMASTAGAMAAAAVVGALLGLWWGASILHFALLSGAFALGFSAAAKLPLLRSQRLEANNEFERARDGSAARR